MVVDDEHSYYDCKFSKLEPKSNGDYQTNGTAIRAARAPPPLLSQETHYCLVAGVDSDLVPFIFVYLCVYCNATDKDSDKRCTHSLTCSTTIQVDSECTLRVVQ